MNIFSFALLFLLLVAGAIAHWVKKKMRGEIGGSLLDYFIADYPGRSVSVLGVLLFTATTTAASTAGAIVDPLILWQELITTYRIPSVSVLAIGGSLATGWAFDSGLNKGRPK